jgi:hypothetical protein
MALGLLLSGCGKPWQNPGPATAFENFLLDLYTGKRESAFESLTPEDRKRLTNAIEQLEGEVPEEALPKKTQMLVTGRVDNPYDLEDIEHEADLTDEPAEGEVVELTLEYHDGRTGQARVVWGGERWFVDLPEARVKKAAEESADDSRQKAMARGEAAANALVERLQTYIGEQETGTVEGTAGDGREEGGE